MSASAGTPHSALAESSKVVSRKKIARYNVSTGGAVAIGAGTTDSEREYVVIAPAKKRKQVVSSAVDSVAALTNDITVSGKVGETNAVKKIEHVECSVCQKLISNKKTMAIHMRTHSGEKPSVVDSVAVLTDDIAVSGKVRETNAEKKIKPVECSVCQKLISNKKTMAIHMRTHTGEKPYECILCNKSFAKKVNLTTHIRTHTGETPFECVICSRKFSLKQPLDDHMRTHTGEKPFECTVCEYRCAHASSLEKHAKIHTGESQECTVCGVRMTDKHNFNRHMRIHTGDKPFKCLLCPYQSISSSNLNSHMRSRIHNEKHGKVYRCPVCGKGFAHGSNRRAHMRRDHQIE